jgi:hypothetical protein
VTYRARCAARRERVGSVRGLGRQRLFAILASTDRQPGREWDVPTPVLISNGSTRSTARTGWMKPAIDPMRCMAPRDPDVSGGPRCQAVATHFSQVGGGRICARCAAFLRERLRDPNTLGNTLAGGRARTEEEICRLVVELPPEA